MNIEGVIKFFEARSGLGFDLSEEYGLVDKDIIIEALQRGEKFEKIYNELEKDYKCLPFSVTSNTLHSMRILKEKYFPKPKTEIWERFINVDFPNSESVIVKMVAIKKSDGNLMISYEPQYNYGEKLERGNIDSDKKT